MPDAPPTRQHPAPPPPLATAPAPDGGSGIDLPTLIITAVASATAAYVCSKVWAPGTLASAAFTPVLVALVKEGLRRPTEVVTTVVPVPAPGRLRRRGQTAPRSAPGAPTTVTPPPGADLPEPAIVAMSAPPITRYGTTGRRLHWRVAILTGLLGFVVAAAAFTLPELIAGDRTTYFGGGGGGTSKKVVQSTTTTTTEVVVPGRTVTTTAPTTTTTAPSRTTTVPAPSTGTSTTTTPTTPASTGTTPATPSAPTDTGGTTPILPAP